LASIPVGVVVERRKAQSEWIDFTWTPVSVLTGVPAAPPWTVLSEQGDRASFYAGAAEIGLYRTETAHYRDNLASGAPRLWVALRATGVEPPYELIAVTADPTEGEGFAGSTSHLVDVVPMPEAIRTEIAAFVAEHHVERPFYKRQRDRADPQMLARRGPPKEQR
jgi:hypothetical protein